MVALKKLLLLLLSMMSLVSLAIEAQPQIVNFYDGDTVKIKDGSFIFNLRISEIDAPERNQPYGKKARRALTQFCKNAQIDYRFTGVDKYQRQLGELYCNQQPVSTFMVTNGHAWFYRQYAYNPVLNELEANARHHKLGLWKQKKPTPPWAWRKRQKR